jgi:hypothetical protein
MCVCVRACVCVVAKLPFWVYAAWFKTDIPKIRSIGLNLSSWKSLGVIFNAMVSL